MVTPSPLPIRASRSKYRCQIRRVSACQVSSIVFSRNLMRFSTEELKKKRARSKIVTETVSERGWMVKLYVSKHFFTDTAQLAENTLKGKPYLCFPMHCFHFQSTSFCRLPKVCVMHGTKWLISLSVFLSLQTSLQVCQPEVKDALMQWLCQWIQIISTSNGFM